MHIANLFHKALLIYSIPQYRKKMNMLVYVQRSDMLPLTPSIQNIGAYSPSSLSREEQVFPLAPPSCTSTIVTLNDY